MYFIDLIMQATTLEPIHNGDFSFWSLFVRADWVVKLVMLILIVASIWSWAIAVDKGITMFLLKRRAKLFEETFWSGKTLDELSRAMAGDTRDPMARVFAAAMREYDESMTSPRNDAAILSTRERIDRVMNLVVNRELSKAERGLSVLATIGSASVFIGLFGTVWGIMNSFRAIAASQNTNLSVVAPGIAEALFATALGLIAAIPAVIFYNKYSSDIDKYADSVSQNFERVSSVAIGTASGGRRQSSRRRGRKHRLNAEINVTPLVDVMLVLLIVFMIAAPLLSVGVPVELPKTDAKSLPSQQEPITITVDFDGKIFIQEEQITLDELASRLVAVSANGYDERIYLRADQDSDYGAVMRVMARVNSAGFSNLGLVTDPISQ